MRLFCPQCNEPLVAKNKGKIKEHHFTCYAGSKCEHGYETILRLLAKNVIQRHHKLLLPKLYATVAGITTGLLVKKEEIAIFDRVMFEKRVSEVIPDIIVHDKNNTPLFIEIKVTHGIDDIKMEKIKKMNISTLEIDLSKGHITSYNEMLECLTTHSHVRSWIYNKEAEKVGQ